MSSLNEPPVMGAGQPFSTRAKGWLFATAMLFSAVFGVIYIVFPLCILIFLNPRLYRKLLDRLVGIWVIMPSAVLKLLFGSEVRIKGDFIDHKEPALIIMNHRTRLDWLFFWQALYKMDPWLCCSEKISLKGILKYVPGAGVAMQAASFIFLDRSFESDKEKLDSILNYFANCGRKYQLLLFPEGTDKCPRATERSLQFSQKKGLVHYDYVLHPRVTGFVHIVQTMRRNNNINYLYDVTIGFGDAIVQSEVDLISHGACPKEIYYQVVKIPIDTLPMSDEALGKWLIELWRKKEEKLKQFYAMPSSTRQFANTPNGNEYEMDQNAEKAQFGLIFFWGFTTLFWMFMWFESAFMFYWGFIATIFYICMYKFYGGLEFLAIDIFNKTKGDGMFTQAERTRTTENETINT